MTGSRDTFDESLLSGYLDGALTQSDEQRVQLHLEDSAEARRVLDELRSIRHLTLGSEFAQVPDDQWDERPRGAISGAAFRLGWVVFLLWLSASAGFALFLFLTGPESVLSKLFVFAGLSGVGLLFLSVCVDRLKQFGEDRYRGVER